MSIFNRLLKSGKIIITDDTTAGKIKLKYNITEEGLDSINNGTMRQIPIFSCAGEMGATVINDDNTIISISDSNTGYVYIQSINKHSEITQLDFNDKGTVYQCYIDIDDRFINVLNSFSGDCYIDVIIDFTNIPYNIINDYFVSVGLYMGEQNVFINEGSQDTTFFDNGFYSIYEINFNQFIYNSITHLTFNCIEKLLVKSIVFGENNTILDCHRLFEYFNYNDSEISSYKDCIIIPHNVTIDSYDFSYMFAKSKIQYISVLRFFNNPSLGTSLIPEEEWVQSYDAFISMEKMFLDWYSRDFYFDDNTRHTFCFHRLFKYLNIGHVATFEAMFEGAMIPVFYCNLSLLGRTAYVSDGYDSHQVSNRKLVFTHPDAIFNRFMATNALYAFIVQNYDQCNDDSYQDFSELPVYDKNNQNRYYINFPNSDEFFNTESRFSESENNQLFEYPNFNLQFFSIYGTFFIDGSNYIDYPNDYYTSLEDLGMILYDWNTTEYIISEQNPNLETNKHKDDWIYIEERTYQYSGITYNMDYIFSDLETYPHWATINANPIFANKLYERLTGIVSDGDVNYYIWAEEELYNTRLLGK